MTNRQRAIAKLIECKCQSPEHFVDVLDALGLLAPDPPPRYTMEDGHILRMNAVSKSIVFGVQGANQREKEVTLAALNAMQEE